MKLTWNSLRKSIKKYKQPKEETIEEPAPENNVAVENAENEEKVENQENLENEPMEAEPVAAPVEEEKNVEEPVAETENIEENAVPEEQNEEQNEQQNEEIIPEESPSQGIAKFNGNGNGNSKQNPFKRIDAKIIEQLPEHLKDNSFNAKFKYGSGDYFGIEGHAKLKDTKGKGFRKEKSKFKNKNFQGGKGGKIIYAVNSTKFED